MNPRLAALRDKIVHSRYDTLLITFLPNIHYLSGFSGSNGLCIITKNSQAFLSDGRYRTQAKEEVNGFRVIITAGSLFAAAQKKGLLQNRGAIGFEQQHVTVAELKNLKRLLPHAAFTPTSGVVERLAAVKDRHEVELIKKAVDITDAVFKKLLWILKPGIRELDVAAEISYLHRTLGAEADAFEPIVASGVRGALPHARATEKRIKKGELVTIDMGGRYRGYHSDLTRTVAVGRPTIRLKHLYEIVADAQRYAIEAAGSGISGRTLDAIARTHIRKKGYGKYFNHSLGHGLGLQVHELPRLSALSTDVLETGNVVTIEPGVYIPGVGGVRIEDDVVIRNGFCEVLNRSPKELIVL
jgi:Xaa-Pro aminopeptidase